MVGRLRVETEDLIRRLTAELQAPRPRPIAVRLAIGVAAPGLLVLLILLGAFTHNPHLAHFGPTIGFSLAAALALAAPSFAALVALSRPDAVSRAQFVWVPAAVVFSIGIGTELIAVPQREWLPRLVGTNPLGCFVSVLVLSMPILAGAIWALREGAPERPVLSGALAGSLAGGVTAGLYLVHCPEDSLLFTLAWHVPALMAVAVVGAGLGHRLLRW